MSILNTRAGIGTRAEIEYLLPIGAVRNIRDIGYIDKSSLPYPFNSCFHSERRYNHPI